MNFLIAFLLSLLKLSLSNVWDNIFTQANSPHYNIAENFEIKLFNIEANTTAGQMLVSSELGLIKLSLILSEENEEDSFIQILVNFTNGKVYFDTEEKCLYKYIDLIGQVTPKFILNAYDILSYFSQDENYYHYIVTNPLKTSEVNNNAVLLLAKEIINDFGKNYKKYQNIYDENLYADFFVDKKEEIIKTIKVKTEYGLLRFNTEYAAYNITIDQFMGIHNTSNCTEYE